MFPLILIVCPLALAASFSPRQDPPEGAITLAVFQETTSSETSVGVIEQKCLVLVDDPSQRFCMVLVDGVGDAGGLTASESVQPAVSIGPTISASDATTPNITASLSDTSSSDLSSSTSPPRLDDTSTASPAEPSPVSESAILDSSSSGAAPIATESLSAEASSVSSTPPPLSQLGDLASSTVPASVDPLTSSETSTPFPTPSIVSSSFVELAPSSIVSGISSSADETASKASVSSASESSIDPITAPSAVESAAVETSIASGSLDEPSQSPGPTPEVSSTVPSPTDIPSDLNPTSLRTTDSVLTITQIPSASLLNPTASLASADLAAAAASITSTPGQKMQVLPIGLGVVAGLVVITLIVVGYVMYERREYKRQFRTRKLAEGMKYGSA